MPPVAPPPRQQRPQQQQAPPAQPGTFEQLHPRGRGGKWIAKPGDGTGASGPDTTTAQLQQRLRQLGFKVPLNGQYDGATQAAVAAFQGRYGLDPHGGVDAATMALLQNPPDQTLKQAQATRGLNPKGNPKSTKSAKKSKSTKTTGKGKGGSQAGAGRVTGGVTARSLGKGSLAQGQGMTGAPNRNVTSLQKALTVAGYPTAQDGRFGPKTEEAVKQLQSAHGLTADGVVGPATKGLLIGLQSTKATPSKKIAARKAKKTAQPRGVQKEGAQKQISRGEVATLRTAPPHARHGSRTAGSRMQLKPPAKGKTTLKYHAEHEETPVARIRRLEEQTVTAPARPPGSAYGTGGDMTTTVAFGVGGQPSMSIPDGRDQVADYDKPIWNMFGRRVLPSEMIEDGRTPPPFTPLEMTIQDGRNTVALLEQAVADRKAAATGSEFVRARAREQALRARLEEGWLESLHPRGRGGKWVDAVGPEVKPGASLAGEYARARQARSYSEVRRVRAPEAPRAAAPTKPSGKEVAARWQAVSGMSGTPQGMKKFEDAVHEQMGPAPEALTVHTFGRNLPGGGVKSMTLNHPISTSRNEKVAGMFGNQAKDHVHLEVPKGHPMWEPSQATGAFKMEHEVVLPKGSKIHIDRSETVGGVTHHYGHVGGSASKPPSPPKPTASGGGEKPTHFDKHGVPLGKGDRVLMPEVYGGNKEGFITGVHKETGRVKVSPGTFPGVTLMHPDSSLELVPGAGQRYTSGSRPGPNRKVRPLQEADLQEAIGPIKKGAFHAWLGKPMSEPITAADIARGKAAGGHPAKMAHFAEQARGWGKKVKKKVKRLQEVDIDFDWCDEHADEWLQESEKTAGYSVTHSPLGAPGGPGLWRHKGLQLPAYIQNVAKGIMKSGKDRSAAIASAIAVVKRWAAGGGHVSPEVKAAAAKAVAEWEKLKASH